MRSRSRGSASLTVPIWTGLSLEASFGQAKASERAAIASKSATERSIGLDVAIAYWEVRRRELEYQSLQEANARYVDLATMAKRKMEADTAPAVDYTRAQTEVLKQAAALADARGTADAAETTLSVALQLDEPVTLLDEPSDSVTVPPLNRAISAALARRPELRALDAQLEADDQAARAAWGSLSPQVSLFARLDATNQFDQQKQPQEMGNFTAGVFVDWKIFDSLDTYVNVRSAALARDRRGASVGSLRSQIRAEVRKAHTALKTALEKREPLTQALASAETSTSLMRRRYEVKSATFSDVLQTESTQRDLHLAVVENAIDIAEARASLQAAVAAL